MASVVLFVGGAVALVLARGACLHVWSWLLVATVSNGVQFVCVCWADMLWLPREEVAGAVGDAYVNDKLSKMPLWRARVCRTLLALTLFCDLSPDPFGPDAVLRFKPPDGGDLDLRRHQQSG